VDTHIGVVTIADVENMYWALTSPDTEYINRHPVSKGGGQFFIGP